MNERLKAKYSIKIIIYSFNLRVFNRKCKKIDTLYRFKAYVVKLFKKLKITVHNLYIIIFATFLAKIHYHLVTIMNKLLKVTIRYLPLVHVKNRLYQNTMINICSQWTIEE